MKKTKRNKFTSRDFLISASVTSLTIECQKDLQWHPNKLLILWGKENTTCQTKPVPWQPGITNPYCGIHVWNEPDPVKIISTLYKNTNREGHYQDKPWKIIVKNECKNGRHEDIAMGCIDIADYISETRKTYELRVTLTPAKKNVSSALIEFSFTSVMIQDGIQLPHPSKKQLMRDIMKNAIKSAKHTKAKAVNSNSPRHKGTVPVSTSSVSKALPSQNPSVKVDCEAEKSISQADPLNTPGVATSNNGGGNNDGGAKKVMRKRRPPPRPPVPPNCHNTAVLATMAVPVKNKWDIKDMKRSSVQGKSEDKGSFNADSVPSSSSKRSLSSDGAQVCEEETTKDPSHRKSEGNEPRAESSLPQGHRKKRRGRKNSKKHLSGDRSSEKEAATSSSKEEERKGSASEDETSLNTEKTTTRDKSSGAKIPEQTFGSYIATEDVTGHKEQAENGETFTSKMKDAEHRNSEQHEGAASGTQAENSLEKICAGELYKTEGTDSVDIKKQRLATLAYYEMLLQRGTNKGLKKNAPQKPALQASGTRTATEDVTENKEQEENVKTSTSKTKNADHHGSERHEGTAPGTQAENSLDKTSAGEQSKTEETDSVEKEKQRLATSAFYEKLLQRGPNKGLKKNVPQKPALQASGTHTATKDVTERKEQTENGETSNSKTKDADHHDIEQQEGAISGTHAGNSPEKTPAGDLTNTEETDSEKEKQRLATLAFYEKLLQGGPNKGLKKNALEKPALQNSGTHIATEDVSEQAGNDETSSKMKETDHRGSEQHEDAASEPHAENSLEKTPAGEQSKTEETDLVAVEKEKQSLASFWEKLLQKGHKKAPGTQGSSSLHKTAAKDMSKTEETDSVVSQKEKQRPPSFYQKLLQKGPIKVSKHCPDLSAYVAEEMKLLQAEIVSLGKVTVKLEVEMRQVMGIKDCKEELDGLRQDWLTLNEQRKELKTRKRDLEILDKKEDLEQCCDILRTEIEILFKLEEWRKTGHHRSQEARLLDLLLCLEDKRNENC